MPYNATGNAPDIFSMMNHRHQEMNQMANRMMQGFSFDDPFKDDPFFSKGFGGFGGIDKMMNDMKQNMM